MLQQETPPLVYSSADPEAVAATQRQFGKTESSESVERLFRTLPQLSHNRVSRIVVAGGETSGAVVSGLQAETLEIGPPIAPGVPALKVSGRGLALALKSGNFGGPDFFSEALSVLEGPRMSGIDTTREQIALYAKSLFDRGLAHGSTGNISVRLPDGSLLVTPTGSTMGSLDPGPDQPSCGQRRASVGRQADKGNAASRGLL